MQFVAKLEQKKPYKSHFRTMEMVFTASSIGRAYEMVNDVITVLSMGNVTIVDIYRDDRARAF